MRLSIQPLKTHYTVIKYDPYPVTKEEHFTENLPDYFIDGQPLSKMLNVGFPWWKVPYPAKGITWRQEQMKNVLTGGPEKRLRIYECHCGAKECGGVFCDVVVESETVRWKNFRFSHSLDGTPFEPDWEEKEEEKFRPRDDLIFPREEYEKFFKEYFSKAPEKSK